MAKPCRTHSHEEQIRRLEETLELARDPEPNSRAEYLRAALEHQLGKIYAARARQQKAAAEAQRQTRSKQEVLDRGHILALCLRSAIRAVLGPRNERLTDFGIAPLRKRRRRPVGSSRPGS